MRRGKAPEGFAEHLAGKVKSGEITAREAKAMSERQGNQPLVNATKHLTLPQALEVFKLRNKDEDTPELKAALEAKLKGTLRNAATNAIPGHLQAAKEAGLDTAEARQSVVKSLAQHLAAPESKRKLGEPVEKFQERAKPIEDRRQQARDAFSKLGVTPDELRQTLIDEMRRRGIKPGGQAGQKRLSRLNNLPATASVGGN